MKKEMEAAVSLREYGFACSKAFVLITTVFAFVAHAEGIRSPRWW